MKRLGRVNHSFPSLEDVRGAANDRLCKNVVTRFLTKFWIEGEGQALAFDKATAGTHEVRCVFSLVGFSSFLPFSFYVAYDFVYFVSWHSPGMLRLLLPGLARPRPLRQA